MFWANKETASLGSANRFEVFPKSQGSRSRCTFEDLKRRTRKEETENNEPEHNEGPEKEDEQNKERGGHDEQRHTSGNDSKNNYRGRRPRTFFIIVLFNNKWVKGYPADCLEYQNRPLSLDLSTGATCCHSSNDTN
jgi:hypothetical protein